MKVHGIHADFIQSGEVGGFNAHTAMVNLVAAVGVYAAITSLLEVAYHYCGCGARCRWCQRDKHHDALMGQQATAGQQEGEMQWLRQQVEQLSQENARLAAAVRRLEGASIG